ncbi:MAG: hypothetical protein MUP76_07765 [Acidimicrobiia bacterium]|nr:hypothetical protein [Acidimicrobiia bacterium]
MKTRITIVAAFLLVLGACGGSSDTIDTSTSAVAATTQSSSTVAAPSSSTTASSATTTTSTTEPPDTTVTSEDGNVSLRIPFEAAADTQNITIRVLSPEEYPPALAGAAQNPGTVLYSLEPAGTTFSLPVRVTRRIPVENFTNVPVNGVPLIALLVTSNNGESFEQLPGAQVIREGDEFLVRAEISHFSTLVSIYELQYAVIDTPQLGADLMTEIGTPVVAEVSFFADDGTQLMAPPQVTPSGWTRADDVMFSINTGDTSLGVTCGSLGSFQVGLRYDLTLPVGGEATGDAPGFHASPVLTGSDQPVDFRFNVSLPLTCLSPETAVTGRAVEALVGTDHPGGQVFVPNENFKGGRSGLYGRITLSPRVTFADPLVGLIDDVNGNGVIDATDTLYPATPATAEAGGFGFVAPLYGYGNYFLYMLDGSNFEGETTGSMTVHDGLLDLRGMFGGSGRFETSIGLLGLEGIPYVHQVGSGEGSKDITGELLVFITPHILTDE